MSLEIIIGLTGIIIIIVIVILYEKEINNLRTEIDEHKEENTDLQAEIDARLKAITALKARVKSLANPFPYVSPERIRTQNYALPRRIPPNPRMGSQK